MLAEAGHGATATDGHHLAPAIGGRVTSSPSISPRSDTNAAVDGTTASIVAHSASSASAPLRASSTETAALGSAEASSASNTKSPSSKRNSSNTTSVAAEARGRAAGLTGHDVPFVEPDAPRSAASREAQPPRLLGGRQEAQNVGKGKCFERALKSHDDLRKGLNALPSAAASPKLEAFSELGATGTASATRRTGPITLPAGVRRCVDRPGGAHMASSGAASPVHRVEGHRGLVHQHPQTPRWCAPRRRRGQQRRHERAGRRDRPRPPTGSMAATASASSGLEAPSMPSDVALTTRSAAPRSAAGWSARPDPALPGTASAAAAAAARRCG